MHKMHNSSRLPAAPAFLIAWSLIAGQALPGAQNLGSIEGTVILAETGEPLHGAAVLLTGLGRTATSDNEGRYHFDGVPPGRYSLLAHLDSIFTEDIKTVTVRPGIASTLDFSLELAAVKSEINVTAGGEPQTAFESFQSVESLDSYDLAESVGSSLGEVLGNRPGSGLLGGVPVPVPVRLVRDPRTADGCLSVIGERHLHKEVRKRSMNSDVRRLRKRGTGVTHEASLSVSFCLNV